MNFLPGIVRSVSPLGWVAFVVSSIVIVAACVRFFETENSRVKRAERKKKNDLRLLADKISGYGSSVHRRYPTGDVIVGERDLAEQLRKRPDSVIIALNLLLKEQKVQRAPLNGYWKLND